MRLNKTISRMSIITLCGVLVACGKSFNGTYADQMGATFYSFQNDGTAYVDALGFESQAKYTVDGDRLIIQVSGGQNIILRILNDKSLQGPFNIVYTKKIENSEK